MAPLLKILVQWLPSLPSLSKSPACGQPTDLRPNFEPVYEQQQPIDPVRAQQDRYQPFLATPSNTLSAVAPDKNRVGIFGLQGNNLTLKWWDGSQWLPSGGGLDILGNGLATPPVATSWGQDHLAIFGLDDHNVIKQQYWNGQEWKPSVSSFDNLGGGCDGQTSIAVTSWGEGRLDIFCRGPEGDLLHQYYDGSSWQPSVGSLESLGGFLHSGPSAVSWGPNRLDIFALNADRAVVHLYWDGYQWSNWETFGFGPAFRADSLTVTSWGENDLDVFALDDSNALHQLYWDGYSWKGWSLLSDVNVPLSGKVSVTSWSPNRIDIVALSKNSGHYLYKFWEGQSWQPSWDTWYDKVSSGSFKSNPAVGSWGENRLDIFGESADGDLLHQTWTGYGWYPGPAEWETLAKAESA